MQSLGSVASIVAAIREDAAAEADHIDEGTAAEIAAIRAEGTTTSVTISDRQARLAAARSESAERLARQEWEGRRKSIEQREAWIGRVIAAAREERRTDPAQLMALIAEALNNIATPQCEVAVAQRDLPLVRAGKKYRVTAAPIDGGCIVTTKDLIFDNSLEARARRLEPVWRKALSEVYRP